VKGLVHDKEKRDAIANASASCAPEIGYSVVILSLSQL
jgi:hypothetical protein